MADKVVSLTAHRNTSKRRQRHEISGDLMDCAKALTREKRIVGYAVIAWDEDLTSRAFWQTTAVMPQHSVPEFVKQHMLAHINAGAVDLGDD